MTDKPLVKRKNELRDLIEGPDFRAQLLKALPKAMSPERFVRITATSMMRNPKLMQCSRETFFRCLLDLSAMGLEPDARQAHLIPRRNKTGGFDCTLIVDYKGLKELMYRNGDIIDEHSDVVGDMDTFSYSFGSHKHLDHEPNVHSRGKIFCAYSHVKLPRGGETFDVMNVEEIEAIRKRSSAGDSGPWVTDWSEMAKKTVFRRLSKSLPLSPKTRDAMEIDQTYDSIEPAAITTTRHAFVGGPLRRESPDLPEELEPGYENEAESVPTETAEEPVNVPVSPSEPVSAQSKADRPPGPLTLVRMGLKESGFTTEEFLTLLRSPEIRMIGADIQDISEIPAQKLKQCLDDWRNVLIRLERGKAPVQEDFPS